MLGDRDTIAAIATARGLGALSVVRISGTKCSEILRSCFVSKSFDPLKSHQAFHGYWKEIDEVLVLNYVSGHGFTGESAAEIMCHGGPVVTNMILESILEEGARLANPGEFSYRAVMNGKMDLVQAENILELIHSRAPLRSKQALKNIKGYFSSTLDEMEKEHIYLLAQLEASIDFTTEDIQPVDQQEMAKRVEVLKNKTASLLESYNRSVKFKNGMRVAIVGKPNGGKSSLLNALTGTSRSIVTPIAGTTRDTIEAQILVSDQLLTLIDTAGLRESADIIEKQGIERTTEEIETADIVVYVVDGSVESTEEDVRSWESIKNPHKIICLNKKDLNIKNVDAFLNFPQVQTSCVEENGTADLMEYFKKEVTQANDSQSEVLVSTLRQKQELEISFKNLSATLDLLKTSESPDLISFELKNSLLAIHRILGKDLDDKIMDKVFKEFCIGK